MNKKLAPATIRKLTTPPRRKKPPVWLYPNGIEREYHRDLKRLCNTLRTYIKEMLLPQVPAMLNEVEGRMPNDRADDYLDRLNAIILSIEQNIQPSVNLAIVQAADVGYQINRFNDRQFKKTTESVFGIDLFADEPWLLDQLKLFSSQNAQLIKNMTGQELTRVSGIVERGLQEGKTYRDVAKDIQKSFGISDRHAKLIARDQTKKLNSSLTRLRQQNIGVEEYIWRTSGDERVRPTHKANEGKKFRWDDPPKVTGHPGNDVNCRCVAVPVLDKIFNFE